MINDMSRLPKVSAEKVAEKLSKNLGKPHAKSIAKSNAKLLNSLGPSDLNSDIFNFKQIQKNARFWTQVAAILSK